MHFFRVVKVLFFIFLYKHLCKSLIPTLEVIIRRRKRGKLINNVNINIANAIATILNIINQSKWKWVFSPNLWYEVIDLKAINGNKTRKKRTMCMFEENPIKSKHKNLWFVCVNISQKHAWFLLQKVVPYCMLIFFL